MMSSLTKLLMVLVLGFSVAACQQQKEVVEEKAEEVVEEVKQEMKKAEKSDSGTVSVDPATPVYKKVSGVSGNINSVGSDTMNNLMALWCEGFAKYYPNVRCQIEGKGSSTAPPALIEGTSTFGPMSRAMKSKEIDAFEKAFGYKPVAVPSSIDTLAVYVNKDNPVECLSIKEVDAVFSKNRTCGGSADIATWDQAGLDAWAGKPISVYGRNSASGTYGYFKKKALCKGDYKDTVKEQPGSASVVQGITEDLYAIGYSGIGYKTSGVKAIALSKDQGCAEPNLENVVSKKYPLGRYLYLYVNKEPNSSLDPLRLEFLKYIMSVEGQEIVIKDGYLPLPASVISDIMGQIGG